MKVITIGRSSQNNVIINDSKVSRHHCQIVQYDDGSYGIVDFGSTNGTYVNGRRVQGEERMNPNDVVRIGYTTLPWRSYFGTVVPPPKKTNVLPIVLGIAGGVLVMAAMIVLLVVRFGGGREKDIYFTDNYPPVAQVTFEQNGYSRSIEAVQGQVMVYFADEVSHREALRAIKKAGGKVVAQIPKAHYYLVSIVVGGESTFMQDVQFHAVTEYVYPNAVSYPCMAKPHVIDNFNTKLENYGASHGKIVKYAIEECGTTAAVSTFDAGIKGTHSLNRNETIQNLETLLSDNSRDDALVINLSFGPPLEGNYWDEASSSAKKEYISDYINEIVEYLKLIKEYDDKDFVIVKAAGNEGVKMFGKELIAPLYKALEKEHLSDIMTHHFLLVTAEDTREQLVCPTDKACTMKEAVNYYERYSNEMEKGRSHSWVTKVDISDFKYNEQDVPGTSIASPRAACFISSVANSKDMKVTEVLKYVRKATKQAPDHILTKELLEKAIEEEKNKENTEGGYKKNGCLKYRLVKDNSTDMERLELHNTCDEDISVTGYLLNKIAPHGGDNTLDFETVVHAKGTEYVDGFVENECTITSVEKEVKKTSKSATTIGSTSTQGNSILSSLVGSKWTASDWANKYTLEFVSKNKVRLIIEYHYWDEPESGLFDCRYDSKRDWILVVAPVEVVLKRLRYKNGRLIEIDYGVFSDEEYEGIEYKRLR